MKSNLLLSVLLSAGISSGSIVLPAFCKEIDLNKASRSEKWLWAHSAIAKSSSITDADRAKAFAIIEQEEANLDKTPTVQSAISFLAIVDFYNKAGEVKLLRAKETKAVVKIEAASKLPGMSDAQITRLAQGLETLAKSHLVNGIAESKTEMDRAEVFYHLALNLRDRLQAQDPQRGLGYRHIIKFYLENHEPKKANDMTIRLSQLGGTTSVLGSGPTQKDPCPTCGKG